MKETKKDIILDENYCYKFDEETNRYELYFQNNKFPGRPNKIFKFYSLSLYNLASLYDGYFYQANPMSKLLYTFWVCFPEHCLPMRYFRQ